MANIKRLASEDKLISAGPFEGGGGIFIFKTNSTKEVQEWISTDPAVAANRWNIEIHPYQPVLGSVCKAQEPYEMVTYNFVRFWPETKKYTQTEASSLMVDHEAYWKKYKESNPVVTYASFGVEAGDILITTQAVDENILANDPSVVKGLARVEKKLLWIAKGSFCEK